MIVALAATSRILHESIAAAGMGLLFFIYAVPVLSLAFVVWAVASRQLTSLTDLGEWRWSRPSCSRAECGRSSGAMA